MTVIPPNSSLTLYRDTKITDGQNVAFKTKAGQDAYFAARAIGQVNNMTYIQHSGIIKIQATIGVVSQADMVSWINPNFDNRRIYARIVDYIWISNNVTGISFVIDWYQTFMFDFKYQTTPIVRETLSKSDWAKAQQNPFDPSVLELHTPEMLDIPEEMYKVKEFSNGIFTVENGGSDLMFVLRFSPFRGAGDPKDKDPSEIQKEKLDAALEKARQDADALAIEYGYEWSSDEKFDLSDITGALGLGVDIITGHWDEYLKKRKKIESDYKKKVKEIKNNTYKTTWERFTEEFSDYIEPAMGKYGCRADYLLVAEYNQSGLNLITRAIEYLTLWGCSHAILSTTILPRYMLNDPDIIPSKELQNPTKSRHAKLHSSPFTYIEAQAPDGAVRRYYFEQFQGVCRFALTYNIVGVPITALVPINYRYSGGESGNYGNMGERLEFAGYPQIAVAIDAYFGFMAQQAQAAIMNRSYSATQQRNLQNDIAAGNNLRMTLGNPEVMGKMGTTAYGAAGAGANAATAGMGAIAGAGSASLSALKAAGAYGAIGEAALYELSDTALSLYGNNRTRSLQNDIVGKSLLEASQVMEGDVPTGMWGGVKDAMKADTYFPGSTGGWLPMLLNGFRFRVDVVTIKEEYVERFEHYFDIYGYASGRVGTPHVIEYTHGGEGPEWQPVDGLDIAYIQTNSFKVSGVMKPAADYIAALFDKGCRFIKGD